jgi:hypothetical protein
VISIINFFSLLFFVITPVPSTDDMLAALSLPVADFEAAISPIVEPSSSESLSHVSSGTSSVTGECESVQSVCHQCGWVSKVLVPTHRRQGCRTGVFATGFIKC